MSSKQHSSIVNKIRDTEYSIHKIGLRLNVLDKLLKQNYDLEERAKLEKELADVKKQLYVFETELKVLHKENSKSFAIAAILLFFTFLLYGIYSMLK